MQRDARAYLWDVREAADAISAFVANMTFETYAASPVVHSAIERKFEIAGEALNQLSKLDASLASRIPEIGKIIAFRNLLIHGYATVEHARVWAIARDYVPTLRIAVDVIFDELNGQMAP